MRLPRGLLRHRAHIEPHRGEGAHGPLYGPARSARCLAEHRVDHGRGDDSTTSAVRTVLRLLPTDPIDVGDRVTVAGEVGTVAVVARHRAGLGTPDHVEVTLQ